MKRAVCLVLLAGLTPLTPLLAQEQTKSQAELEKEFQARLSGAVLVGSFTVDGKNAKPPREERYEIKKVTKQKEDIWLFHARIQYGDKDVTVPVPLYVKWAGDTPVLTLTDLAIPNMGTFTARVLIYRDHYAGYWQHGDVKGTMFGRIEPAKQAEN